MRSSAVVSAQSRPAPEAEASAAPSSQPTAAPSSEPKRGPSSGRAAHANATAHPASTKPRCDPPFVVDANGDKKPIPGCY